MEPAGAGDLVTVATGGPAVDAIVVEVPSSAKAVVAMMDRRRGPVLRTVDRRTLTQRAEAGPDDRALQLLIRRTSRSAHSAAPAATGGAKARQAGHARGASHRTTGK